MLELQPEHLADEYMISTPCEFENPRPPEDFPFAFCIKAAKAALAEEWEFSGDKADLKDGPDAQEQGEQQDKKDEHSKQMGDTRAAALADATETEDVEVTTATVEAKTKQIGDRGFALVQMKEDLDDTQASLAVDKGLNIAQSDDDDDEEDEIPTDLMPPAILALMEQSADLPAEVRASLRAKMTDIIAQATDEACAPPKPVKPGKAMKASMFPHKPK